MSLVTHNYDHIHFVEGICSCFFPEVKLEYFSMRDALFCGWMELFSPSFFFFFFSFLDRWRTHVCSRVCCVSNAWITKISQVITRSTYYIRSLYLLVKNVLNLLKYSLYWDSQFGVKSNCLLFAWYAVLWLCFWIFC